MATILKIDMRSSLAKDFIEFAKKLPFVQVEEQSEKSPYDPEFVKKIKRAQKQKGTIINTDDVWGSLGFR